MPLCCTGGEKNAQTSEVKCPLVAKHEILAGDVFSMQWKLSSGLGWVDWSMLKPCHAEAVKLESDNLSSGCG